MANISQVDGTAWEVNRVHVQPEDRGQGIGRCLLAEAVQGAFKAGAEKIYVTPYGYGSDKEELYTFYNKCGFKHDKQKRGLMLYTNN